MTGQAPSSKGSSIPSHMSFVAPFLPAWPSCRQMRACEFSWVKATMRANSASCASFHSPVHPGVMRASGATQVISVKMRPAPPMASAP